MKLIAGLGNPGARYHGTRHNVGFGVVDQVAGRRGLVFEAGPADALVARVPKGAGGLLLAKPLTFMNRSGAAVADLQRFYKIPLADLLVVVEEVHLPLGRLRVRARGSAGGHKGLGSVIEALGTEEVPRLRIGVGRGDERRDLADHVLSRFEPDERDTIAAAISLAADAVELFVAEGVEPVMNRYNRKSEEEGENT